jgi:signal transduction histidine kinase
LDNSLPLYLVGPLPEAVTGPLTRETAAFPLVREVPAPDGFPAPDDRPGWVLLSAGLPGNQILDLLLRLAHSEGPWSSLLLLEDRELLPLSPGYPLPVHEAAERMGGADARSSVLSLRLALGDVARVRHDLNNPLTAALAEVQLLRMERPEGSEDAEALEVVEEQLKRIRDMVAGLASFRVRPPS